MSEIVRIVGDIETVPIPPTAAELAEYIAAFKEEPYKPSKAIKDPVKQAARELEHEQSEALRRVAYIENAEATLTNDDKFKIGGCQVISASFGILGRDSVEQIEGLCSPNEHEVAAFAADYLSRFGPYKFIGWNSESFDWPQLVYIMGKHRKFPRHHPGKWDHVDLLRRPFGGKGKLKKVAQAFGLEIPDIDGSDVLPLYKQGDYETILHYNKFDVKVTGGLALIVRHFHDI